MISGSFSGRAYIDKSKRQGTGMYKVPRRCPCDCCSLTAGAPYSSSFATRRLKSYTYREQDLLPVVLYFA